MDCHVGMLGAIDLLIDLQRPLGVTRRPLQIAFRQQHKAELVAQAGLLFAPEVGGDQTAEALAQDCLSLPQIRLKAQCRSQGKVEIRELNDLEGLPEAENRRPELETRHQRVAFVVECFRLIRLRKEAIPKGTDFLAHVRRFRYLLYLPAKTRQLFKDLPRVKFLLLDDLVCAALDNRTNLIHQLAAADLGKPFQPFGEAAEQLLQPLLVRLTAFQDKLADFLQFSNVLLETREKTAKSFRPLFACDGATVVADHQCLEEFVPLLGGRRGDLQGLWLHSEPSPQSTQPGKRCLERLPLVGDCDLLEVHLKPNFAGLWAGDPPLGRQAPGEKHQKESRPQNEGQWGLTRSQQAAEVHLAANLWESVMN